MSGKSRFGYNITDVCPYTRLTRVEFVIEIDNLAGPRWNGKQADFDRDLAPDTSSLIGKVGFIRPFPDSGWLQAPHVPRLIRS
jgi:hypothetical protein